MRDHHPATERAGDIHRRRRANAEAPPTPENWREHIVRLLAAPGIEPPDAEAMRCWLAWRHLPARYWQRVRAIAERAAFDGLPDDLAT